MARTKRSTAGRAVMQLAQDLSDRLLREEEATFRAHAQTFADNVPAKTVMEALGRHEDDPQGLTTDTRLRKALVDRHRAVLNNAIGAGDDLFTKSAVQSVDSIHEELLICESTLAAKYVGCADEAVERTKALADDLVVQARKQHRTNADALQATFQRLYGEQMLFAKRAGDDGGRIAARLISPVPVRGLGIGGRGIWHRTPSLLDASARHGSIGLMNSIRTLAMQTFNEVGRGR